MVLRFRSIFFTDEVASIMNGPNCVVFNASWSTFELRLAKDQRSKLYLRFTNLLYD